MNKKNKLIKSKIISGFKKNVVLGSLVLTFLIINIFLSLQTVSSGSKLSNLEKVQVELTRKNRDVMLELVAATALSTVEREAASLGYINADSVGYIKESEVVASRLP